MTPATTPPSKLTLILLTGLSILSLNMFLPSLGSIARDLSSDFAVVSIAVAGYLALSAVVHLIAGPLSDKIGRRPVVIIAIVIFVLSSVACAVVTNVWVFLAFRMLQGGMVACGAIAMAAVRDTHDEQSSAGILSTISAAMALAPMLGPVLGGFLDAAFGWRSVFWFYAMSGVLLLLLVWVDMGETRVVRPNKGSQSRLPVLLGDKRYWAFVLCTSFSVGSFFIFLAGASLVAESSFGISSAEIGLIIGSITFGFMSGSFISSKLSGRLEITQTMLLGRVTACSGLIVGLIVMTFVPVTPLLFLCTTLFVGIGNGLTLPNSNAGSMSVHPDMAGSAAGISAAFGVGLGALLTFGAGVVLAVSATPKVLVAMMLASAAIGLFSAYAAHRFRN